MKKFYHTLLLLLMVSFTASAQFYVTGDDPGKLRWSMIESDNFKIIYPEGNDSLAYLYGNNLENSAYQYQGQCATFLAVRIIR